LLEVYDGENTPDEFKDAELERLRAEQQASGKTLTWTLNRYKKLFGKWPAVRDATELEKKQFYRGLQYGLGFRAKFAYKAVFGVFP
jgi:hypothetical protein